MSTNLNYPSVSVFLQSSILLQKLESRDRTPTETAPGAFLNVAAQLLKASGAHLLGGHKSSNWLGRVNGSVCSLSGSRGLVKILRVQVLPVGLEFRK